MVCRTEQDAELLQLLEAEAALLHLLDVEFGRLGVELGGGLLLLDQHPLVPVGHLAHGFLLRLADAQVRLDMVEEKRKLIKSIDAGTHYLNRNY